MIFHYKIKRINRNFLEKSSLLEILFLLLFPFCPLFVAFYMTIFEITFGACRKLLRILFHWIASVGMMVVFYKLSQDINMALFFLNNIMMDFFSIVIAKENGKIINPMNSKSFVFITMIIFILFYGFYWIFAIQLINHLLSLFLYIFNAFLIYFHLKRSIFPLYGNTPIHIYILNKVIPFVLNILISVSIL